MANKKDTQQYTGKDITVLEGLEPVRRRPGMYIGTTGKEGLNHLIREVFDNSRDEAMGGYADHIEVTLLPGNRVRVADNGRGIPVDTHEKTKVSTLETVMTTLHAGGKFGGEGYKISGGLHGVGVSVVNALSTYARAEVHRDGEIYTQEYNRGQRKSKVKKSGSTKKHGTIIEFEPDPEIFPEIAYDWKWVVNYAREQAYLVPGLRVTVLDAREYDGGGYQNRIRSFSKSYGLICLHLLIILRAVWFRWSNLPIWVKNRSIKASLVFPSKWEMRMLMRR